jgi:transcriptional regulator with XRE-family HTH domain
MDRMDKIRANITKSIKASGESRLKIAERAGISYHHLTRFLNNTRGGEIGIGTLQRIADVLQVPVSYLIGDTDGSGRFVFTSEGIQLPEEWNQLFQAIYTLPKRKQESIQKALHAIIDAVE